MDPEESPSRLDALVLAYDEALRQGRVPWQLAVGPAGMDADEVAELEALQGCLRKLEQAWPRGNFPSTSLTWHTEAACMAAALQDLASDEALAAAPITTVEGLKKAVVESGLTTTAELEAWLGELPPDQKPQTAAELAYELVQRDVLNGHQALTLCKGDLDRLLLGGYLILNELGRGGLGVVYKALDRRRNVHVALKTLHQTGQDAISRLKREFRALADLVHPNLVVLDELRCAEGRWFFTMELLDGQHFADYVRSGPHVADAHSSLLIECWSDARRPKRAPVAMPQLDSPAQSGRLRHSLRQLAAGLDALHRAGKLHRDIKPSNVLITREGRVVLVDFGMAIDVEMERPDRPDRRRAMGTVPYMSPEQSEGRTLTEASDWYSVGVMLYQTLSGRLPFLGTFDEMLEAKRRGLPVSPSGVVPAELVDLAELCHQLLRPDPNDRPQGAEILQRLGCQASGRTNATQASAETESPFVGREPELGRLNQAFADVQAGRPVSVYVEGPSGIGKTALVTHFVEQLGARQEVLLLGGRCYERESVPYKALDGILDALSRYLRAMPSSELEGLLPDRVACLVRVFPALRQIPSLRERSRSETVPAERREVRRRAVLSLRHLLNRLAGLQPIVLVVDDLQWGDADSALVLNELLDSADSPPLLLIGCCRSEDLRSSPCLQTLLETAYASEASADRRRITLHPLSPQESRVLALALLQRGAGGADRRAADLSEESQGNPYFLAELVKHLPQEVSRPGEATQSLRLDLEGVVLRRVGRLPQAARELLKVIAIAGHPLRMEAACRAIRSTPDPRIAALLRSEHLIRTTGSGQSDEVETYHDRIRETITSRLSAEDTRGYHARLATTLEASPEADPQVLCVHFDAAGDTEKASRYGLLAADRAADALAFDRAARLYEFVLGLRAFDPADEPGLQRKLADALANAGRGAQAAEHYLAAAGRVAGIETVELKRLGADQLLRTGRYQDGRRMLGEALSAVGLRLPKSPRQAILMILVDRLRIWLRGRRFRLREEAQISREQLVQLDTCLSAGSRLALIEGLAGVACGLRYRLLAARVGEPSRVALALAYDALVGPMVAGRQRVKDARLFEAAEALAKRHENSYCVGYIHAMRGELASFLGHWRQALQVCDEAEAFLRQHCAGVYWEISLITLDVITSLFFLGEIKELSKRIPRIIRETQERNDLFAGVVPRTYFGNLVWLAADQIDEARRQTHLAMAGWPRELFLLQHVFELIGSASIDLYASEGPQAWDRIARAWPDFKRSWHIKHRFPRILLLHLRARAALASLGPGRDDRGLLRSAERDAKKILREPTVWSRPLARLVRAAVALARGRKKRAVEELETAVREFDTWEMALYSAAAKTRLGELIGGQRGRELIAAGTQFMTEQGVVRPDRMTPMLAPGFE